jgi:hypothetical protein
MNLSEMGLVLGMNNLFYLESDLFFFVLDLSH